MAKVLGATCEDGVVKVGAAEVPDAEVLSEGVAASLGLLLLDGDLKAYLTSSASDLKEAISQLTDILTQVQTILTGLDGATNSPGAQAGAISTLSTLNSTFETLGDNLK